MTSLKTILEMLKRRLETDPSNFNFADNAEYVAFSLREIDKLTVLVNDLLAVRTKANNEGAVILRLSIMPHTGSGR